MDNLVDRVLTAKSIGNRALGYWGRIKRAVGPLRIGRFTVAQLAHASQFYARYPEHIKPRVLLMLRRRLPAIAQPPVPTPISATQNFSPSDSNSTLIPTATSEPEVEVEVYPTSSEMFTAAMLKFGNDPTAALAAISLLEKAAAIDGNVAIPIQLAAIWRLIGQPEMADRVLEAARRGHPHDPTLLRHYGTHLLRNTDAAAAVKFYSDIPEGSPLSPFGRYVLEIHRRFPLLVASTAADVTRQKRSKSSNKSRILIGCMVMTERAAHLFATRLVPSLLTPGNLPGLALHHEVTFVLTTTQTLAGKIRNSPSYEHASQHARFVFATADGLQPSPELDPASQGVARALCTSMADYTLLEVARRLDATVVRLEAGHVTNETFLREVERALRRDASIVFCPVFPVTEHRLVSLAEDGVPAAFAVSSAAVCALAGAQFNDLGEAPTAEPSPHLRCREGAGVALHASRLVACVVRGRFLRGPLGLSLEPVDGRFLSRHLIGSERMHVPSSAEMALLKITEAADTRPTAASPDGPDRGIWLALSDPVHLRYFQRRIRFNLAPASDAPSDLDRHADEAMRAMVAKSEMLRAAWTAASASRATRPT